MRYILLFLIPLYGFAQNDGYWQQKADYKMEVSMDVKTYLYKGKQELVYTNNSNDTLKKVFYHLYNNAFNREVKWITVCKTLKIQMVEWLIN